jgi:uncharacterized protein YgiM (DUF1202 family)
MFDWDKGTMTKEAQQYMKEAFSSVKAPDFTEAVELSKSFITTNITENGIAKPGVDSIMGVGDFGAFDDSHSFGTISFPNSGSSAFLGTVMLVANAKKRSDDGTNRDWVFVTSALMKNGVYYDKSSGNLKTDVNSSFIFSFYSYFNDPNDSTFYNRRIVDFDPYEGDSNNSSFTFKWDCFTFTLPGISFNDITIEMNKLHLPTNPTSTNDRDEIGWTYIIQPLNILGQPKDVGKTTKLYASIREDNKASSSYNDGKASISMKYRPTWAWGTFYDNFVGPSYKYVTYTPVNLNYGSGGGCYSTDYAGQYKTTTALNLRTSESTANSNNIYTTVKKGTILNVTSATAKAGNDGWAKVYYDNRTLYASTLFLSGPINGGGSGGGGSSSATYLYKVNASGGLKLRKTASTSGTVLTTMAEGTMVYVKSISNGWAYVYYKKTGQWGYASVGTKPYLVKTTYIGYNGNMKVTTSGGKLNLRTGPGTGYSTAYQVSNGTTLHVVGYTSSWAYVYYNGGYYYASKKYLK